MSETFVSRHTQAVRIDESSPRVYLLMVVVAAVLIGIVLAMFWSELAGLMRGLSSTT
ncbi:MAG TPA: hypothetical protein VHX16_10145 [Chloroflexota bacterium]|nr:hypothetical protein [Chloroflexota bacterium]